MENINWLAPEILLGTSIISLIVYGVIGEKRSDARKFSQQRKITILSIISLSLGIIIMIEQMGLLENQEILIKNGIIGITQVVLGVKLMIALSTISILLMSIKNENKEVSFEITQLILLSVLGLWIVIESKNLVMLYLGIELSSLSLYALAASKRTGKFSTEAGLKYFILGALSSGILLFGMGLIYISTGQTGYTEILAITLGGQELQGILEVGAIMIIVALLFKLAAAPFHMWAPDVYEGSPTIITAYFLIVPKIGILAALYNFIFASCIGIFTSIQPILILSTLLSIGVGSIGAINQTKIKRLLAYSGIAHMGFILMGFIPGTIYGLQASFLYIVIYILMSINTFIVVLSIYKKQEVENNPVHYISQVVGLSRTNPALAINFAIVLLSIAGIPPLGGFLSKFIVLNAAIDAQFYILAIISVCLSVVGTYYYLRIIKWMYFKDTEDFVWKILHDVSTNSSQIQMSKTHSLILGLTLYFILTMLLYPFPFLSLTFDLILNNFIV